MAQRNDTQEETLTSGGTIAGSQAGPFPDIRNFHKVNDWLYRGGQPTKQQFYELARMGIKTVICLRWGNKMIHAEQELVRQTGMEFISIPMFYWQLASKQGIHDFLALLDDANKRPIFVHCFHGADRTGLLIAMYRMSRDGWGVTQAYAEMKLRGFHRFRIRHFKWILFDYARRLQDERMRGG